MQNKFTKSVMERLEQDAKNKKAQSAAPQEQGPTKEKEKKINESTEPKIVTKEKVIKESLASNEKKSPDLSAFLQAANQREAKNKTFYLDSEVIDALHSAAKRQKMTDSRLCNEILRSVLGLQ